MTFYESIIHEFKFYRLSQLNMTTPEVGGSNHYNKNVELEELKQWKYII